MKLRELFDKLTPGMLDTDVNIKQEHTEEIKGKFPLVIGISFRSLERVEVEDDNSITLVVR